MRFFDPSVYCIICDNNKFIRRKQIDFLRLGNKLAHTELVIRLVHGKQHLVGFTLTKNSHRPGWLPLFCSWHNFLSSSSFDGSSAVDNASGYDIDALFSRVCTKWLM